LTNLVFRFSLTRTFESIDGSEAKFGPEARPLSYRQAFIDCLCTPYEGDQNLPMESRVLRMELAHKIRTQDILEMNLKDVALLLPLLTRKFVHPILVYRFIQDLDACAVASNPLPIARPDMQVELKNSSSENS
jgi:hypothetical protein